MELKFWQISKIAGLLLTVCITSAEIPKPVLNSWIEVSTKESWPSPESSANQPFYVYHPEWVRRGFKHFGFNASFLTNVELIGELDFNFKYWTNDDLGRFRATDTRGKHHDILLNQTNKLFQHWWQSAQISQITKEIWSNYSFIDGEDFLVAFKDASVTFTEKSAVSKLAKNAIHGYQAAPRASSIVAKSGSTTNFTVNVSTSPYLTRIDSQPEHQDMCYTVKKPNGVAPIEIYFTLEGIQSGTHLTTITSTSKKICINDFIALRNLIKYQLTVLVPQRVDKAFELFIEAKAESRDLQLKAPLRSVHDQLADVITEGWYFYHPHFSYEIHGFEAKAEDQAKFWLCDIVANCFPYNLQRDEHHRSAVYSISPLVKTILDSSPFVRIESNKDLSTEALKRKYELFHYAWSARNIEQMLREDYDWINFHEKPIPGVVSSGPHVMKANKTHTTINFEVPIGSVDLRAFQLHVTISKIPIHENSTVTVNKLTFKPHGSTTEVDLTEIAKLKFQYHLNQIPDVKPTAKPTTRPGAHTPKPELHPIVKTAKEDIGFIISTDDFFYVEAFNAAGKSVKGTFVVNITSEPENGTAFVGMSIRNELMQREAQPQTATVSSLKLQLPKDPILKHTANPPIDHTKSILSSGLIRSSVGRTLPPYSVSIKVTSRLTNKPLKAGDIHLTRNVLSHGTIQSTDKTALLKVVNGSVVFEETSADKLKLVGAAFEVIFLLELKDLTQEVAIGVSKFELKPEQGSPSKQTGPIIATMDTKFDPFLCPKSFKANAGNTSCSLDTVYRQMSVTCDNTPGCPQVFSPPLITSEVYYDSRHHNARYFPTKMESSAVKTEPLVSTLEIGKPKNATAFCVDFAYKSADALLVSSDASRKDVTSTSFSAVATETKGSICSNKLTPSTSSSMYFRFDAKQQRALGANYITNLNLTASK